MARKKDYMDVVIDRVDYPNRARGFKLESIEENEADRLLEMDSYYDKRPHGRPIVAKGGIPGQVYRAKGKRARGEAKEVLLLDLLRRSPLETPARCPHFDRCGGCVYQTLSYETELMLKGGQIRRLFQEAGLDLDIPIYRSPHYEGYRNKMEYSFGDEVKDGPLTLGLHRPGHFYEIVPTPFCKIVPEDMNTIRRASQAFFREKGISYYHKSARQGALRHLVLRTAMHTGQIMVNLVTTSDPSISPDLLRDYVDRLTRLPLTFDLVSIFHTQNDAVADAVIPEKVTLLYGQEELQESLMGLTFHIGPFSFFQPNVFSAENLYAKAMEFAGDLTGKTVYDLYSGTGTLTQLMAKRAQRAIGVEIVEEAVDKARETAQANGLANAKFLAGDVLEELDRLAQSEDRPDLIMIDPPREGIHPKALEKMIAAGPDKIVYISCNPRTQVRDLQLFIQGGYRLVKGQAFDQFPRTKHVETVCLMVRDPRSAG